MTITSGRDQNGQKRVESTETAGIEAVETKRLAARRRFLLGGAAAVPIIVTLGQKEAWAASAGVCQSMGLKPGYGFSQTDLNHAEKNELAASMYCRP